MLQKGGVYVKKTIIISLIAIIAIIGSLLLKIFALPFISFILDMKTPSKDDIFEYVETESKVIADIIQEVESLEKEYRTQGFGPNVKTISHTDIDEYVEEFGEVKGLYIYMSDPSLGGSYKEIDSELLESVFKNKKLIREISRHDGGVSFFCGGSGFGSSTSYYGFYYSFDGAPKDYWCGTSFGSSELLKPDGVGFSIKYSNDDNCYYTEKIMDNFYYYEAHF